MKLYFGILYLTIITLVGCKKNHDIDYAFLGGEIINATDNYVILSLNDSIVEKIKLDENNRFIYKIRNLQSGFYTFKHGGELQTILLEPEDSIMLRLNTYDFDESLVYTGQGAKKNNYFINEFLQNEIEEKRVFKYCQLNSKTFSHRIDSIKVYKNKKLDLFNQKHSPSNLFNKIAQANIDYNYYSSKEIYPFIHYGTNKCDILKSLPKDFYTYRKDINYDDVFYENYFIYNSFLKSNMNNLALERHVIHNGSKEFQGKSICYNLDKLHLIDSIIKNPIIKNKLLYYNTFGFLNKNTNIEANKSILKSFLNKSTNANNKKAIANLVESLNELKPGKDFPPIDVVDFRNNYMGISDLVNKPTAIYFWSHKFHDHFKQSHKKVNELKIKYPEMNFLAINIDVHSSEDWLAFLTKNKFAIEKEYLLKDPKKSKEILAIHSMTKVIVVNDDKKIIHSHANIFDKNFEEKLLAIVSK